ncbi:unnamed protein product [Effrenium voratum]|nr:unnamed protein product [Effrenium voratum]
MSVPLFAAIDIPMSRVPEDRLRQLFEDEEDRMLQLAEEQRCAWVSLIADTRARLAAVARGSLSRTSATQQPAVPETADPFPAIPEMAVRRMEWYDLQSAGSKPWQRMPWLHLGHS